MQRRKNKTISNSVKSNNRLRKNVKRFMKQHGLDQRAMEAKSRGRLTQAAISYLLSGQNIAKLSTVDELARILKCPPWQLLAPPDVFLVSVKGKF